MNVKGMTQSLKQRQHPHKHSKAKLERFDETVSCAVVGRCKSMLGYSVCVSVCEALSSGHIALAKSLNATLMLMLQ